MRPRELEPVVDRGMPAVDLSGTKALMLAILEDAIRVYRGPDTRERDEAEAWVLGNRRTPFSFTVVCEVLGLEPSAVRAALLRVQSGRSRVRPNAGTGRGKLKAS